jgi:hypothetical protein
MAGVFQPRGAGTAVMVARSAESGGLAGVLRSVADSASVAKHALRDSARGSDLVYVGLWAAAALALAWCVRHFLSRRVYAPAGT